MDVKEFEKKLIELTQNVPNGTTLFMTYSNENSDLGIQLATGKKSDLIAGLSELAAKNKEVEKILRISTEPELIEMGRKYFNHEH